MKSTRLILWTTILLATISGCNSNRPKEQAFIDENIRYATIQMQQMLSQTGPATTKNYPRTTGPDGTFWQTSIYDWTPGFFPGSLWYLYELTGDTLWRSYAEEWTYPLERQQHLKSHHDIGFIMYCSYGNAQRLAPKPGYDDILLQSARSLCTRYNDTIQAIKSWNYRKAWNGEEWFYPVIIDNMMNLELLCYASHITGNPYYRNIAIRHADKTLQYHLRPDHSSYHVVDYDIHTGLPLHQQTCQGYSDNSTWARGQAWAVYGYTMMYRETKHPEYLQAAQATADYFISHLPEDFVPYWDFNAGTEGYQPDGDSHAKEYIHASTQPRDASAAAIACSALFELGELADNTSYTDIAIHMLHSLASPNYRAPVGENGCFMIEHCTGSLPHESEIDVPLVYADYYFLEALVRYQRLLTH